MTAKTLAELEMSLRDLSHSDLPLQIIQAFASDLGKTKQRQMTFNAKGELIREPIFYIGKSGCKRKQTKGKS